MSEAVAFLIALGQQVWQQQGGGRAEDAAVCIVSLAPFLLGAAAVGLRSLRRTLRHL